MLRSGVDAATLAQAVGVDAKTVSRWIGGRVPHRTSRALVAKHLGEDEITLWPTSRPDQAPGASATAEIVGAWAHRADVPTDLWVSLLDGARERVDLLGYAYPFMFEITPQATETLAKRCAGGLRARIAVADPNCPHVAERDALEQLGGTLAGRIRLALHWLADLAATPNATVGLHSVHLYNSVFRFDDQMIVTPHIFRGHGYQHPTLYLRRLSGHGIFETFAEQFQQVWDTVRTWAAEPTTGTTPPHPSRTR
ncbi:XRE family transcriptional regulator [Phytohabitans aurantiacus]|uniref:Transcriptional regulator n=1 Tax=Phytohabitans aurantiacus TaxID=3016789 RepID=A0ABQ5R1J2_9ACTN|nr:XRE family transcriptional regulator [Phytohabitans aurantiacus]GLI00674.1 transcriptional regulator [Phytohabitans aurantiacus]